MRVIQKYQSEDGNEFNTKADCLAYERLLRDVTDIQHLALIPKPEGCDFANGGGYVQQDAAAVCACKRSFLNKVEEVYPSLINAHWSCIGRTLSDSNSPTSNLLYRLWVRFECIDSRAREWNQPYFAHHPNEGKQIELRPS